MITPELIRQARKIIQSNPEIGRRKLAEKLNTSTQTARIIATIAKNPDLFSEDTDLAIKYRKLQLENKELRKDNKRLIDRYNEKEDQNNILLALENNEDQSTSIPKITKDDKGEAIANALLSDIHCEEKVDPDVVLGMNEYNPDICRDRIRNYFQKLLKIINHHRKNYRINTLVLGLLGDMITGYIHEDLKEENFMSPTEATMFVKEHLVDGIKFLSEYGEFDRIIIPCAKGNHGRTTYTKRFGTAYKNSYEWMMYHDMKKEFQKFGYNNVEFVIPKSEFTYIEVFGRSLFYSHGDHFGYQGGIGGFQVPMMKWALRQQMLKPYDAGFIGHWHQILHPASDIYTNGSVIGHTSFAVGKSIKPSQPAQLLNILHKDYGFTEMNNIIL